jgi:hypothetical protein
MTPDQAAALFQLGNLVPDERLLGPFPPVSDPIELLKSTDLVDDAGRPPHVLAEALEVLARPVRAMTLTVNVPGITEWAIHQLAAPSTGGPYVIVASTDEGTELFVLSSELEVVAILDDFLDLTTWPARPVSPDLELDLAAWVGMMAASDVGHQAALQAELQRRPAPPVSFDAAALEDQLTAGYQGQDTRWAVTASVPTAPVDIRHKGLTGEEVMTALIRTGLAEMNGDVAQLTALGADLGELIEQSIKVASFSLMFTENGREVRAGEVTIIRSPLRFGMAFWHGGSDDLQATFLEPTPEAAVEMLREMLTLLIPSDTPAGPAIDSSDESPVPEHWFEISEDTDLLDLDTHQMVGALTAGQKCATYGDQDGWVHVVDEDGRHGWVPLAAGGFIEAGPAPTIEACPSCGATARPESRFCARCGARLTAGVN